MSTTKTDPATHETFDKVERERIPMKKSNADQPKAPESNPGSKPNLKLPAPPEAESKADASPHGLSQAAEQNQLTEDGPNESEGKKTNPFQKFLNSVWGPIRG
jgi:H+-transporting ATPase